MKICLISTSLFTPTLVSGIEVQVRRALKELVRQRHQIVVITTAPSSSVKQYPEEVEGAKVYSFRPLNIHERSEHGNKPLPARLIWHGLDLWNPHAFMTINRILKKETPDIVHIHNFRGLSFSVFSVAKISGLPLIFTAHDYSLICPKFSLLRASGKICQNPFPVCKMINKVKKTLVDGKPDIVTAPSQFVINKLNENGLFNNTKTLRLPNAIDLDNIRSREKNYEIINILYSGQLTIPKGTHILIDAFRQIKYKNIKLYIVGRGSQFKKLKRLARDDVRIIFRGFLFGKELAKMYERASVTVVPSIWYEPFGLIIIESFRYGTPVVASNIGSIPEIIQSGYNGVLFEAGNVTGLRELLESLIENPFELRRLSKGAFQSVRNYDVSEHVNRLQEIYEQAISGRRQ